MVKFLVNFIVVEDLFKKILSWLMNLTVMQLQLPKNSEYELEFRYIEAMFAHVSIMLSSRYNLKINVVCIFYADFTIFFLNIFNNKNLIKTYFSLLYLQNPLTTMQLSNHGIMLYRTDPICCQKRMR